MNMIIFQAVELMQEDDDEGMEKQEEYEDESELDVGEAADLSPQNHVLVRFTQGLMLRQYSILRPRG